jgi:hypothetical protein
MRIPASNGTPQEVERTKKPCRKCDVWDKRAGGMAVPQPFACLVCLKLHSSKALKHANFGRSSDLLLFWGVLPIPCGTVELSLAQKLFGGAYSSGSVQDLHLIPFFIPPPKVWKRNTKIGDKLTQNIWICSSAPDIFL